MFNDRFAHRMAARYRKKGLDKTARRIVELLTQRGVQRAACNGAGDRRRGR
jgi:hypothetical protein